MDTYNRAWFAHQSGSLDVAITFTTEENARFVLTTRLANVPLADFDFLMIDTGGKEWVSVLDLHRAGVDPMHLGDMIANLPTVGNA